MTSTLERENLLAAALEAEAALPALKTLQILGLSPGGLIALARALQGGSAPVLQHIDIHGRLIGTHDEVWDSIADMVEARASLPGCARFESFEVGWWLTYAPLERQIRLLRALLPSLKTLPKFWWNRAFEACFLDVQPPALTNLELRVDERHQTVVS